MSKAMRFNTYCGVGKNARLAVVDPVLLYIKKSTETAVRAEWLSVYINKVTFLVAKFHFPY